MAIIKIIPIKDDKKFVHSIEYITDESKTTDYENSPNMPYITPLNCGRNTVYKEMMLTKKRFGKEDKILAHHCIQSFKPGELTPYECHRIGIEFALEAWGDRFEVIVATHINADHLHNHFIINSVSVYDGKKYYDNLASKKKLMELNDKICKEHGLSVVDLSNRKERVKKTYTKRFSRRDTIMKDIDYAISVAKSFYHFKEVMQELGYEFNKDRKHLGIRFVGSDNNKFFRFYKLAPDGSYSEESIKARIKEKLFQEEHGLKAVENNDYIDENQVATHEDNFIEKANLSMRKETGHTSSLKVLKQNSNKENIEQTYLEKINKENQQENNKTLSLSHRYVFWYVQLKKQYQKKDDYIPEMVISPIMNQTILLCEKNIKTLDELHASKLEEEKQLTYLCNLKDKIYRQKKNVSSSEKLSELNHQIKAINRVIDKQKQIIDAHDEIEKRSTLQSEKTKEENFKNKEVSQNKRRNYL